MTVAIDGVAGAGPADPEVFMLSLGQDLQDNQCRTESCEPRNHAELAAVLRVTRPGADPWAVLGTFSTGLRHAEDWAGADGALLDFDWTDPALPAGDGHLPIPEPIAQRLLEAASNGMLPPGVIYLTRRGFRFGVLFHKRVTDSDLYGHAVAEIGRQVLDALEDDDFPVARAGLPGFALDNASTKVAQVQRLPTEGAEIVLTGSDLYDAMSFARGDARPALPLEAALPLDIATAARQIGAWIQIAPEVVTVHVLAMASALIGNTRYVTVRGLEHNLSLQFLTLAKSSAGKTTVRNYLARASKAMRAEISNRRKQAEREWERYELQLAAWKSGQKSKRKNGGPPGARPEPPTSRLREALVLTDATTEALFKALMDSPRGVLWSTSEAHEILGILGRYSDGGKGRDLDTARLRKLTEGEDTEIHRSVAGITEVNSPFLAIDMDAQPGIRDRLFQEVDKVSGFTARFLIHEPASRFGTRNYIVPPAQPDGTLLDALGIMFAELWATPLKLDEQGRPAPEPIHLDAEAERLWAIELQRLEGRLPTATSDEESFGGHLRGRLLRLAAVLALWEKPDAGFVDATAMRRAILIGRYFLAHLRLAARAARDAEFARHVEAVREWASARIEAGKAVTLRDAGIQWHRYRGTKGGALGVAHLRAAGLVPERIPKTERPGRPKSDRWVLPNAPTKPAKTSPSTPAPSIAGFAGGGPGPNGNAAGDWDARFSAFNATLAQEVDLPPGGKGTCPFCGHDECFGRVKDSLFWKCFSADHAADGGGVPDHGDLVDLRFNQTEGRLPTKDERVARLLAFENGATP
jgi:hypothetical protein